MRGPPLTYEELQKHTEGRKHSNIKNFVETGTYKGDTSLMAAKHFDKVFTTEINNVLYEESKIRAEKERVSNITFLLGDSVLLLEKIVPQVLDGAVFFIDAHISGSDSSWNGSDRVPLMKEIEVILKYKIGPSVFVFNDLRLWKQQVWDWAHITNMNIVKIFLEKDYKVSTFFEDNDKFYVFTE